MTPEALLHAPDSSAKARIRVSAPCDLWNLPDAAMARAEGGVPKGRTPHTGHCALRRLQRVTVVGTVQRTPVIMVSTVTEGLMRPEAAASRGDVLVPAPVCNASTPLETTDPLEDNLCGIPALRWTGLHAGLP